MQQQISILAEDFCSDCPAQVPNEVSRSIPSNIPPFLVDTPASARLRIAYVQSLISDIIIDRIFQPFLFTHAQFDETFNEWAEYLYYKSTKREAIWRQRTLHAAFSCRSSKEKINKFAGQIIEEIVTAIKPFADKSKRQQMMTAVKQIVKTTAETWRYARIELSRITATPARSGSEEIDAEPLLSMFPRIEREPSPNDFRPDSKEDMGCVYSNGQSLTRKSSAIFARRVELGEIAAPPAAGKQENDVRPEWKRPRKMSSEIANRARKFEPRSISPLIPPEGRAHGRRGNAASVSDEMPDIRFGEQHEHGGGWDTDTRHSNEERFAGSREEAIGMRHEGSETGEAEHAAGSSPLQSPAHSRAESPQLSRRSTGTTDSLSEGDEGSDGTEKPGTVPNWEGGSGNIPGAYGW